ncbi:MAG: CHASE2 domain-containing protein [Deltaproteobacteria bacterium]|nr:CHASE2 domain-containing protein [Deltaproteobacteria bacterium]
MPEARLSFVPASIGARLYPTVELAAAGTLLGQQPRLRAAGGGLELWLGSARIPMEPDGTAWIQYRGRAPAHTTRSLGEVLERPLPELSGRVAFVAQTTARHSYFPESVPNPFGGSLSQAELVVTAADGVAHGTLLVHWGSLPLLLVLGLPLSAGLYLARRRVLLAVFLGAGAEVAVAAAAFALFLAGRLVDPVPAMAWIVLFETAVLAFSSADHLAEKRGIQHAFRHYLSPQVLREVLRDPARLKAGGERKEITVLFADVRGFTRLSEKRDPREVAELLNVYLDAMVACIFRHGGTVDKYLGDGILAYFGAPLPQPDHALRAVHAAQDMLVALVGVRRRWAERGVAELAIGIGVHSGPAIVGNLGSEQRLEYTVIGDTVNTASRLQTASKELGVALVLSGATAGRIGSAVATRALGPLQVRGRNEPIEVFTPASGPPPPPRETPSPPQFPESGN